MANVYGEIRDGKIVCNYLGCDELAVWKDGLSIACEEHWKLLTLKDGLWSARGEPFKIPTPPELSERKYVLAKCKAGA